MMTLEKKIMEDLKAAMKAKDKVALAALRAVKSAILKAKTEVGSESALTSEVELKILQKEVKQRKEAAEQFMVQGAQEMADEEIAQSKIIEKFLPEPMSEEEIKKVVEETITATGAESIKDMGKVIGIASKKLAGKAEGKIIAQIVKKLLA